MSINPGFVYTPNIPATNDNPQTDQPPMLVNTNSINSILNVDHVSFGVSNGGIHKVIRFKDNVSTIPSAIAGFGQLFTNTVTQNSITDQQLYYESGGGVVTQLTGPVAPNIANPGSVYLPGGLLMQWGLILNAVGGSAITYAIPYKTFAIPFFSSQNNTGSNSAVWAKTTSLTGFTAGVAISPTPIFYWMVIGI